MFCFSYAPEAASTSREVQQARQLPADIRSALQNREFPIYIQLYADAATGQAAGGEVIPFWEHPAGGLLPAEHWLPVLEQEGLSSLLDEYVLEHLCSMLDSLCKNGRENFFLLYRLSESSLLSGGLKERWTKIIQDYRFNRRLLLFGIPQKVVEHDFQTAAEQIKAIQSLEMKLVLDGFNGQLTTLARAGESRFCAIKLKEPVPNRVQSQVVLRAAIRAGHDMGLAILAEGADTAEQTAHLRELGCDMLRGKQYAHPLPAREAMKKLIGSASGNSF